MARSRAQLLRPRRRRCGGSIEKWTMRSFDIGNIPNLLRFLDQNLDGIPDAVYASDYEKRIRYLERGGIRNFGYSFLGNELDGLKLDGGPGVFLDPPYRPTFGSAYLEGTLRAGGMALQGGLRYEYYDPEFITVGDPLALATAYQGNYNIGLGVIDEGLIIPSDAFALVLPRFNVLLTPSNGTVLYGGYGLFAQMPPLDPLSYSSYSFSRKIAFLDRSRYGGEVSFNVKPERSKQFEIGLLQRINPLVTARFSAYTKTFSNQVQLDRFYDPEGNPLFTQYVNAGTGFAKGFEIQWDIAFTSTFFARLDYAFAVDKGLTSSMRSNRVLFSDQYYPPVPVTLRPLDYEQRHKATVILNATTKDPNLLLDGIHITAIVTLRSGHPYTKTTEIRNLGCCSVWRIGTLTIQDPRFAVTTEAHNASNTPFTTNVDIRIAKTFDLKVTELSCYVHVLNVFNTKSVINVYPATGTPGDDGWLSSSLSDYVRQFGNFESFYRDINLNNRWAYMSATGNDVYGPPRSIQIGVSVSVGGSE